jgi:YgiT-type zinc finger domain-containing protein
MMAKRLTRCPLCGGTIQEIIVKELPRRRPDGTCMVFGDVPATRCESCGEQFFASEVALEMHQALSRKKPVKARIEIPFYRLSPPDKPKRPRRRKTALVEASS